MKQTVNDGGPAFPVSPERVNLVGDTAHWAYPSQGMTLRDYFAAAALTGTLLAPGQFGEEAQSSPKKTAAWAYQQADAMLAARIKSSQIESSTK